MKALLSIPRLAQSRTIGSPFVSYRAPGFGRLPQRLRSRAWLADVLTGIPRCAAEALTPPDGIRSRSLPYSTGEAKTIASAYILRGRGPSVERD
jgi:hypothetical protein